MLPFPCTPSPTGKGAKTVKSVRDAPGLKCQECPRPFTEGKPLNPHERFTDTWVKMKDGKWQCVASHQSVVKM